MSAASCVCWCSRLGCGREHRNVSSHPHHQLLQALQSMWFTIPHHSSSTHTLYGMNESCRPGGGAAGGLPGPSCGAYHLLLCVFNGFEFCQEVRSAYVTLGQAS